MSLSHVCKWCKEIIGDPTSRDYRKIYKEHRNSCVPLNENHYKVAKRCQRWRDNLLPKEEEKIDPSVKYPGSIPANKETTLKFTNPIKSLIFYETDDKGHNVFYEQNLWSKKTNST